MSNIIRIKRRLDGPGALSGAPASLQNAEMAFNEVSNTLYYGRGDNGSGVATEIIPIGGKGYIEGLVSSTSASLLNTINDNLSTVLGADISALQENLNSINELANSLSGDAEFAVSVNNRLNNLQNSLSSSSGGLGNRVSTLETAFDTLTGASQVTTLGTIASQDANNVDITGGTISVSSLTVTGDSSLEDVSASGTLTVDGASTLKSTLSVAGKTSLGGDLDVDGATLLKGSLTVDSSVDLNGSITVDGAATLNSSITVDGTATLNSTLNVTGAVDMSSTLDVTGKATLSGGLDVVGAATVSSTLDVTGAATLNSTLSVVGAVDVDGAASFKDNVSIAGSLEVGSGTATLFVSGSSVGINTETPSEALEVVGNGKFSGNLIGSGTSTLSGFVMDGGLF